MADIELITLDQWPSLLLDDDPASRRLALLVADFFSRRVIDPSAPVPTCLICDAPAFFPAAICVVKLRRADATVAAVSGICGACMGRHSTPAAMLMAALAAWRRRCSLIWPRGRAGG